MRVLSLLVGLSTLALSAAAAAQSNYSSVVAFGDSLSDNGNYYRLIDELDPLDPQNGSPPLPYFFGRYSNGPVAVERLAQKMAVPLHDFAVGGALSGLSNEDPRLPQTGVLAQVRAFVAKQGGLDPGALYVVWGGANDFLGMTDVRPAAAFKLATSVVGNLSQSLVLLYRAGARHFLVPNLPDLGLIPLERMQSSEASVEKRKLVSNVTVKLSAGTSTDAVSSGFVRHIRELCRQERKVVRTPSSKRKLSAPGQGNVTTVSCVLAGLRS